MTRLRGIVLWILVVGVLIGATGVYLEYQRRAGLYWYDVHADYRYSFERDGTRRVPVQVTATGFSLPDIGRDWDTAVLPLQVESAPLGRWFEPYIEVLAGDSRSVQYLDRGGKGRRYLVFGRELLASNRPVSMRGTHVRWPDQGRELLLFSTPQVASGRMLVIAPHPDDAEIAAFAVYAEGDAYIATVTAGDYDDDRYAALDPDATGRRSLRGRVRTWDSLAVPTWGGVSPHRIVNLGYWNSSLADLFEARNGTAVVGDVPPDPKVYRAGAVGELLPGRDAAPTWQSLVDDLRVLIETVRPTTIVAPHPALDAAPDHQFTTMALLEALVDSGDQSAVLLLYTNHHVLSEYYPFGPADSAVTLPPWFDDKPEFGGVYSYPVDGNLRQRKLFALDDMHDLRPAPRAVTGRDPVNRFVDLAGDAIRNLWRNPLGTYSYYRRAIRENELFFVYRPDERSKISRPVGDQFSYR